MQKRKINKIIQILGLILILISALICFKNIYCNYKVDKETKQVIETMFEEDTPPPTIEEEQTEEVVETPKKQEIHLTNNYIGYIELKSGIVKKHKNANIYCLCIPVPGEMDKYLSRIPWNKYRSSK